MEVELVSKDCVKPSSSTPHHLRTHNLTLLDQLAPIPPFYVMLVYPAADDLVVSKRTLLLKQSLSQALTHFYPLAGTLRDRVSVDCDDEGTYYIEAHVKSPLSDHLNQLELGPLLQFLPFGSSYGEDVVVSGSHVTMFQQTSFSCGGMVIMATVSHMVSDGTAFTSFLKLWSTIARCMMYTEKNEHLVPKFDENAVIFRSHYDQALPREATLHNTLSHYSKTRMITSRRFVFDGEAISKLKAEATSSSLENPTRVEVVSALLWRRLMAMFKSSRSGVHRPSGMGHSVNLRRRARDIFSDQTPGNVCLLATSVCTTNDPDVSSLASQIREAIGKIDEEVVKEVMGPGSFEKMCQIMKQTRKELSDDQDFIMFTSWCNFGLYDIDFGWGKPVRAGYPGLGRAQVALPFDSAVMLMDTRIGKGVEALLMLDEHYMTLLENDKELLSYAILDPILSLPC